MHKGSPHEWWGYTMNLAETLAQMAGFALTLFTRSVLFEQGDSHKSRAGMVSKNKKRRKPKIKSNRIYLIYFLGIKNECDN